MHYSGSFFFEGEDAASHCKQVGITNAYDHRKTITEVHTIYITLSHVYLELRIKFSVLVGAEQISPDLG